MSKSDPISVRYFRQIEKTDAIGNYVFAGAALLSVVILLVHRDEWPRLYDWTTIGFALLVFTLFAIGMVLRLILVPRAEECRLKDFYSKACGISLAVEVTDGYYNNQFTEPYKRVAAQTLENALFTREVARKMVRFERYKVGLYGLVWLVFVMNRQTDLGLILAATQAVFSEQIVSRWLRLEWLSSRAKFVFDELYKVFQMNLDPSRFMANALYYNGLYETAKANAGIVLSSKIFHKVNGDLSKEWDAIAAGLN